MKNVCKYALLAIFAASLATVSCTSDMKADLERIEEKVDANQANLQQQISAMKTALDAYKTEVAPELQSLVQADKDLLASLNAAKSELTEALAGKVSEEDFQKAVSTFQAAVDKIIKDQKAVDEAQDGKIDANTLAIETLATRVETYKSDLESSIDTRIKALDAAIGGTIETLAARVTANEAAIKKLNEETIPALEARVKACEENIVKLQTDLDAFKEATAANLKTIGDVCDNLASTKLDASVYNTFLQSFENWKGSVDTHLGSIDDKVTALENLMAMLNAELAILKSDEEPGYITLQAYVEGIRNALQAEIDLLAGKDITMDEILALLDEKFKEKLSALDAEIAALKARVQSLVFVPQYKDLKFGIPFSLITDGENSIAIAYNEPVDHFDVVYKVAPDSLAEGLAAHAKEVFTFVIEDGLKTRAPELAEPKLTILGAEGDNKTGKIVFNLSHENFQATVENDEPVLDSYAVSLVVADEAKGIHVASEYTGTINVPSPKITVDMKHLYIKQVNPTDTTNVIAYTKTTDEYANEMEYMDTTLRYPYKDCFIAAKITPVSNMHMAKMAEEPYYTYEELRKLGYNMPESSLRITTTASDDKCAFLKHADLADAKFAKVNIDSTKALKLVKEHLIGTSDVHTKKLNYAYNNGINSSASATLNMGATITLGKAKNLRFEISHEMNWTYETDKNSDHANIASFQKNYVHKELISKPVLVKGEKKVVLNGKDEAYGIVVSDFYGKAFTKATDATVPTDLKGYNYAVLTTPASDTTFVMDSVAIASWGDLDAQAKVKKASYVLDGSYVLPFSKQSDAKVTINTTDRDRAPIDITLKPFSVTLLGGKSLTDGGLYTSGSNERYLIKTTNLADSVYKKYVDQKIFASDKYSQKAAFGLSEDSEFFAGNMVWDNTDDAMAARFDKEFTNNTQGGSFYLFSQDKEEAAKRLTSKVLRDLAQNYDANGKYLSKPDPAKFVTYTFHSYIGQVVSVKWPVVAKTADPYMLTTYGALENEGNYYFNISPSAVWVTNPDNITMAKTELDLTGNGNIQVVTGTNGEGGISPASFAAKGLVPVFTLTSKPEHEGVSIADFTNVMYYGQTDSVAVKSALYVKSADVNFYVPGSENIYVNYSDKKIDSVFVRKFNPIAVPNKQVLTGNGIIKSGTAGVLPLNMVDINGNYIYKNGYAQSKMGKYKGTVKEIFKDITFTLVSVNGSETFTGWTLVSGATPDALKLNVPASAAEGTYTIVLKAHTCWQDYTYTLAISNSNVSGGIEAGTPDYGNGGESTWK